jgi:hypothetical protein
VLRKAEVAASSVVKESVPPGDSGWINRCQIADFRFPNDYLDQYSIEMANLKSASFVILTHLLPRGGTDINNRIGEGFRSFLGQVVPNTAVNGPM